MRKPGAAYARNTDVIRRPAFHALVPLLLFLLCVLAGGACSDQPTVELGEAMQAFGGESPPGDEPGSPQDPTCPAAPNNVDSSFPPDLGVSETSPAGTMSGSFSVTSAGDAHYEMPLVVPPGRAGLQPKLSIAYDSSAGDGPLGMGFSISGLSVITRCPRNMAQDGSIRPVMYDENDALCLDGRRLVLVGQSPGILEFRTSPDTFVKVLATTDPLLGPQTFSVFTKEGLTLEYGGAAEQGRTVAPNGVIRSWWMTKSTDRSGNFIEYHYQPYEVFSGGAHTAELVPKEIKYTGHAPSSTAPSRSVLFDYEVKSSPREFFTRGFPLKSHFLLLGIKTFGPSNQLAREYRLRYETSTTTGRKRLLGVKECDGGAIQACKPETTFTWTTPPRGFQAFSTQIEKPDSPLGSVMPMDVTGDGLDDLVLADAPTIAGDQPFTDYRIARNLGPTQAQAFNAPTLGAELAKPIGVEAPIQPELGTPLDYNHDGRMDLFLHDPYAVHTTWRVLLTHPNGTFTVEDTQIYRHYGTGMVSPDGSTHFADVNGDGMPDLILCKPVLPQMNEWRLHLWTPTGTPTGPGFSTSPLALPLDAHACNIDLYPVDVDADGRAELVVKDWDLDPYAIPIYKNEYIALGVRDSGTFDPITLHLPVSQGGIFWLDVNGDGLPDAIETGFSDKQPRTYLNKGDGFDTPSSSLQSFVPDADESARLGTPIDWDGDGMQDLLLPMKLNAGNLPSWVVLRSLGDGHFEIQNTNIPFDALLTQAGVTIADPRGPRVMDVDGDGAHDVLLPHNDGFIHVHRNLASQPDVLLAVRDGMNPLEEGQFGALPNVSIEYTTLIDTSITQGVAGTPLENQHRYVSRFDAGNECAYPMRCIVGPRRVVSSYAMFMGTDEPRHFGMRYRDARWHRLGRGSLGFGERIIDDLDHGGATIEGYDNITFDPTLNAFPFAGRPERILRWNLPWPDEHTTQPIELAFTSITHQVVPTSGGASYYTIPIHRRERHEQGTYQYNVWFDGTEPFARDAYHGYTSTTRLSESIHLLADYDQFGNALEEATLIGRDLPLLNPAAGAETVERVARSFKNDTATWQIGLLETQDHCSTVGNDTACRSTIRTYDSVGRTKTIGWGTPGDPETQITVWFSRDAFGNIKKTIAQDAFGGHRATCTSYEPEGIFPYAQRNAEWHLTLTKFDPRHGGLLSAIDPNALTTQWAYDGFGRTTREVRADGTETTFAISRLGSGAAGAPWSLQVTTTATGAGTEVSDLDPLGRVVRTLSPGVATANMPSPPRILREVVYDQYGEHVAQRLVPIAENAPQNQRRYEGFLRDALGRIVTHVSPWGGQTHYSYEGETVRIEDPRAHETITTLDSLGRPTAITDANGKNTLYTYGPFGVLWTVTEPGSLTLTTTTVRDAYGRVRVSHDPDRGTTELHYTGFGELTSSIDALGREMTLLRDRLGRVTERRDVDTTNPNAPIEVTHWLWDTSPGKGIGKIAKVASPADHIERYFYDGLGRPEKTELEIAGETFAVLFAYDPLLGRLATTTTQVPGEAPFVVTRDYDPTGHLLSVRDPAAPPTNAYWTLTATDGAGRMTGERFGNGVTTTRTYFADKNRVESIVTQSNGTTLQNLWYTYDDKLNVETRSDYVQLPSKRETFSYDALDRLECASFDAAVDPCQRQWGYEDNGNLAFAPGLGQYHYDASHRHFITGTGAATAQFAPDAVGNQIARPGATIEYTPFDQPKRFTLASGDITLDYNGGGARIRKTTPTTETVYLGGVYERVTKLDVQPQVVEHRYYVSSSERPVAVITRSAGATSTQYLHVDHLGSVDVVTNGAGAEVERRSYDPFGSRRNPAWGAPGPWSSSSSTTVGFTGHEADDELGLVHMRGRVYDPQVGRFLTPDPLVSQPLAGQSWNPYTYVLNNPLAYVDPSGFTNEAPVISEMREVVSELDGKPVTAIAIMVGIADPPPLKHVATKPEAQASPASPPPANQRPEATSPPVFAGIVLPIDAGTWGNAPRFEPAPPPLPERGPQSGWDIAASVLRGALGAYAAAYEDFAITATLTVATGGLYLGYKGLKFWTGVIGEAAQGYRADGVAGAAASAVNVVNPIAHLAVGTVATGMAMRDGDYEAAGAHGFRVLAMAATIAVGAGLAAEGAVAAGGARQTLYHYTTGSGRAGILESGEIWASQGAKNARHGAGQYFTDIAPEAVGGRTLATTPAGQMSVGQLSSKLFGVPWNASKLSNFLEVDVTGLGARQVAPNIWLIEGESGLSIGGRVVRSGETLP